MRAWGKWLALAALVLLIPATTHAAQSVTITPTTVDQTIDPGATFKGTMKVLNQADTPFDFNVYATPYSVTGEDYDPSFTPIAGATDVTKWLTIKQLATHLEPFTATDITYSIAVPKDTKPGGYYAVIFAQTKAAPIAGTGLNTQKRVGTILYIRVAGAVVESGNVASWDVPWFQQSGLAQTVRVADSGTVHFLATVKTTTKDMFGDTKFSYSQERELLPQKVRRVAINWDKAPAFGLFKVNGSVQLLGQTYPLATKYVLIMSPGVQHLLEALVVLIVAVWLLKIFWRRRAKKKQA